MKNHEDIALVFDRLFQDHRPPGTHPENPGRLGPLLRMLEHDDEPLRLPRLPLRSAMERELLKVHAAEMVQGILDKRGMSGWLDADTYYGPETVDTALLAAGTTMDLALSIWKGDYRRGFSFVRPPGHHATPEKAMGFCLFNHIALAAAAIRAEKPGVRLAIVDFDLHHGNGTQDSFYDDPDVLFLSSHRYPFYPGTGAKEEIGNGRGRGTTVNLPLAEAEGDGFFRSLYSRVVLPMLRAFRPEMILVSAGFDGHFLDPMQGFRMQAATYESLSALLLEAAELTTGKILFVLEGGYHPEALAESSLAVLRQLRLAPRTPFTADREDERSYPGVDSLWAFHAGQFPELRGN